jgi:alanine dehydrogenase
MRIGVPKEIKVHEYRVGLVPGGVRELTAAGHEVVMETRAGMGIGFDDSAYRAAGARIANSAAEVFEQSDLIVKVKGFYLGAEQAHPEDVQRLAIDVDRPHVDLALQPEQRGGGRGGDAVLSGTRLGDQA